MTPIPLTVLGASVVGSPHCAAMCSAMAAFCTGPSGCGARRSSAASIAYHASRLVSYSVAGALAGWAGALLDDGGALVGVQRIAAIAGGVVIAFAGASMVLHAWGTPLRTARVPAVLQRALAAIHRGAAAMRAVPRAIVVGLATPLLPCGWLWSFVAVAAGTGSAAGGALLMSSFWLGTVPALAVVGGAFAAASQSRRRAFATVAGIVMVALGAHMAIVRAPAAERVAASLAAAPLTIDEATAAEPSCCRKEAPSP